MHSADQPINLPSEDRLDRRDFCRALGDAIDQLSIAKDGFVMALCGPWGSGKSSAINLVLLHLLHLQMARVSERKMFVEDSGKKLTIAELDQAAEHYKKIESFIDQHAPNDKELSYARREYFEHIFCRTFNTETASIVYRYFRIRHFTSIQPQTIVLRFSPWLIAGRAELALSLLTDLRRAVGEKLGTDVSETLRSYTERILELAQAAAVTIDTLSGTPYGTLASSIFALAHKRQSPQTETLSELKTALASALRRQEHRKILVVIDDLDRLSPPEAAEVIGLVKGLGDLPNVIYLLTYDHERLSKLIGISLKTDGSHYLEKIVQYSRYLPLLKENDLLSIFDHELEVALQDRLKQNSKRISEAWHLSIKHYLDNLRNVHRLLNTFIVAERAMGEHTDLVDLLVLETLATHDSTVYEFIRQNPPSLVEDSLAQSNDNDTTRLLQQTLRKARRPDAARAALGLLFPKAGGLLGSIRATRDGAIAKQRIQSSNFFHNYFRLTPSLTAFSKSELGALTQTPKSAFTEILQRAETVPPQEASALRLNFLSYLEDAFSSSQFQLDNAWMQAIIDASPALIELGDERSEFLYRSGNLDRLSRIVVQGLDRLQEVERAEVLADAIEYARDLKLLCDVLRTLIGDINSDGATNRSHVKFAGREEELRNALLAKVRSLVAANGLWFQAQPNEIVWFWWGCVGSPEVKTFTSSQMYSAVGVRNLMKMVMSPIISSSEGRYDVVRSEASQIVDVEQLTAAAHRLAGSSVADVDKELALKFFKAFERGRGEE